MSEEGGVCHGGFYVYFICGGARDQACIIGHILGDHAQCNQIFLRAEMGFGSSGNRVYSV